MAWSFCDSCARPLSRPTLEEALHAAKYDDGKFWCHGCGDRRIDYDPSELVTDIGDALLELTEKVDEMRKKLGMETNDEPDV